MDGLDEAAADRLDETWRGSRPERVMKSSDSGEVIELKNL